MDKQFFLPLWILASLLSSCNWQKSSESLTKELVEAELKTINWNELDQFPLFDTCDETAAKTAQQECFQTNLNLHLAMALQDYQISSSQPFKDTILLDFKVDNQGVLTVLNISNHEALLAENPSFNQIVDTCIRALPKLHPALKRGIPVTAKFRVPLVIQVND
jgi:hypothetical protein